MDITDYDIKIGITIKIIRELRCIKQYVIAQAIHVDQSTISRIENGEALITLGQLHLVATALHTSVFQIIAIAEIEVKEIDENKLTYISELVLNFIKVFKGEDISETFSIDEIECIIRQLKKHSNLFTKS